MTSSEWVKKMRGDKTIRAWAGEIGYSAASVHAYESGRQEVSGAYFLAVCKALNGTASPSWLAPGLGLGPQVAAELMKDLPHDRQVWILQRIEEAIRGV